MPVVRHRGRGGGEVLYVGVPEVEDHGRRPLRLGRSSARGDGDDGELRARRPEVPRLERWARVHVQRGGLVPGVLRDPGRGRHVLEHALRGGQEGPCGWLKDKFGLSWQIVPTRLTELLEDPDREKSQRVMAAMMEMRKIDVDALERAAAAA